MIKRYFRLKRNNKIYGAKYTVDLYSNALQIVTVIFAYIFNYDKFKSTKTHKT